MLRLVWTKMRRTWSLVPNVSTYQSVGLKLISLGWTLGVYALALVGVWRLRQRVWVIVLLILPAAYITVLHSVFVGSVRYRLPAMPFLELLAAIGIVGLVAAAHRRSEGKECTTSAAPERNTKRPTGITAG